MRVEIDQSGKIENTSQDTIIAFTNGVRKTIKITARDKRILQSRFREKYQSRLYVYRTFTALIYLLVRDHLQQISILVIDIEYEGREKSLKEMILEYIRKDGKNEPTIDFRRIGNRPPVHVLAYSTFTKKLKPDMIARWNEVAFYAIKKDRGLKKLKDI
ncbi:hypothetical protein KBD81_01120 [Candidatus Woesebacteria bacterium]|nr:hypothetical protein [Candidatus Woesebacteria bacterium]